MSITNQFGLPLLAAAQAQKHVTVNEALARLDALAQLRLVSTSVTVPPLTVPDGAAYGVPTGAVNAWDMHGGEIAVFANGGWVFVAPKTGWRAWIEDLNAEAVFDGTGWVEGLVLRSANGAGTQNVILEFDHVISAGATNDTLVLIENAMLVWGVTGRVLSALTGSGLVDWSLGVASSTARYGNGLSLAAGSWINGIAYQPQTYWGGTALRLSAGGGTFSGGVVRLAIHAVKLIPPGV